MDPKWAERFQLIRFFGWGFLGAIICVAIAVWIPHEYSAAPLVIGVLLILPFLIYSTLAIQWHWKERYRGNHSDLWGGILAIETSGWSKLIYLFRHLIPDMRQTGRYRKPLPPSDVSAAPPDVS